MITVAEIVNYLPDAEIVGSSEVKIGGITHDSRQVRSGDIFAALSGNQTDGQQFVDSAIRAGALAVLTKVVLNTEITQIIVPDPRGALGEIAALCYRRPTEKLDLVGVTGTNGKTTIAYLVEAVLQALGGRPGVMGTVEYRCGSRRWEANHTTPEAPVVQSVAREMVDAGASHLIIEASSHGLELGRLQGCRFHVVAFTNLTQDHLDFHGTMEAYAAAKLKLFTTAIADFTDAKAVINVDDPFGRTILNHLIHPVITVSVHPASTANIHPTAAPRYTIDGIQATLSTPGGDVTLNSPLLGPHNLSNLTVALGICIQLGIEPDSACNALGKLSVIPGRLERVCPDSDFAVLVDYAHTPDALSHVLSALRPLTPGRLICIFGCGGDRDAGKRPLMGAAVASSADIAVVTSDNPRTEQPNSIVEMILPGVVKSDLSLLTRDQLAHSERGYFVDIDRHAAIQSAISSIQPGDTVLIAGKGHEDYQILGTSKIHFDDREEAIAAIRNLDGGADG
jgi:UDP-N-acetylmuramoyl-L-alanyl-D-glutamate--2,6-diaminopimelate ligase